MSKKIYIKIIIISILISIFGLQSCYKDKFDFSEMDDTVEIAPNIGIPLVQGNITFGNLVKFKTDTIEPYTEGSDTDKLVKLIYKIDTIRNYKASEFLKPPVIKPVTKTLKLGVLKIDNQVSDTSITFEKFVGDHFASADQLYYSSIEGIASNVVSKIGIKSNSYKLNKFGNIAWVYTLTGDIKITLTNTYKVPLSCKVLLETDLSLFREGTKPIGTFDFTDAPIAPGASVTKTIPVNGVKISSLITYKFTDITLGAKNPATIDFNDKLYLALQLANLKVTAGKAAIPNQSINKDTSIWFAVETHKGKKLKQLDVYSGIMDFDISSKIPGLSLTMELPDVKKNGKSVVQTFAFNGAGKIAKSWDMSGFSIDLSKNPAQPYNSMLVKLKFSINSNGQQVSFNESNDFTLTLSNKDSLQFQFVRGNLGYDTVDMGKNSMDLKIDEFMGDNIKGKVRFSEPKISVDFENSIGMSAGINLQLTGVTKNGEKDSVFSPRKTQTIERPTIGFAQGDPDIVKSSIKVDGSTRIADVIAMLPHSMIAEGKIITNQNIPYNSIDNFINKNGIISAKLLAELPLKFSMNDLTLRQELDLTPPDALIDVDEFKIIFYAKNQFPLDVNVYLTLLDTTLANPVLDTLAITVIKAAPTNASGKTTFMRHREEIVMNKTENPTLVNNFFKANKLRFEAKLNTYDKKTVSIYTYYSIGFQLGLSGQVKYKASTKINKKK